MTKLQTKIFIATGITTLLVFSFFHFTETRLALVSTKIDTPSIMPNVNTLTTNEPAYESENLAGDQSALVRNTKKTAAVVTASTTVTQFVPTSSPAQLNAMKVMAWIYPGNPACGASAEFADGRKVDVLKPEFFTISGGFLTLLDTSNTRCNGYSPATVARLKQYSTEQYATVSSASTNDMETFIDSALSPNSTDIKTLVDFTVVNNISGIELDFEDFSSWSPTTYLRYKEFVTALGNALHAKNKRLMIDAPAVSSKSEESWFVWRYEDFVSLPVDTIVVMAYDYQYDYGAGSPVAPLDWLKNVITWTSSKYPKEKITIGLPSYGYQSTKGTYRFTILTYDQIRKKPGFATAKRDPRSGEMTWQSGTTIYYYQDSQSLQQKRDVAASLGITSVSIWHLGGNLWF